ncbi:putative aminohydrolase SsnA [Ruminococcaceae bacterium OttesenSCG-928-A16]|nr:putative aminohydrolase SsnA [Ruminococcaceae bacterium OttesenSCG-928-A16]
MLLLGNARLITQNPQHPYLEDGAVLVNGNEIADFGPTAELRAKYPEADFEDLAHRVLMPGLINTHTHIYSSFARGLSLPRQRPDKDFIDILENQWWKIDKVLNIEDSRYSAYSTGLESARYGVTTIFDHHASQHHVTGSLFAIDEALDDIGLRHSLCYEVSDRDGTAIAEEAIAENIAYIDHAAKDTTGMKKGMLGLHASFTLSEETLQKCVAAMGSRTAGYHVHTAEGIADLYDSLAKYGKRVVQRLHDAGILGEKTLSIHNIHINAAEMDILKATGTMAVHNPESNMGNAVGTTPAMQMMEKGLLLGLGTDAYTQDMFESLKVANLIHKHHLCNPSIGFMESMQMLFTGNAAICARYFEKPLGIVQQGALADLIVVDYTPHTPLNQNTIAGHIMFGMMGRAVDSTMINGKYVMKNRVMQTVDEQAVLAKAREQSTDFWKCVTQ